MGFANTFFSLYLVFASSVSSFVEQNFLFDIRSFIRIFFLLWVMFLVSYLKNLNQVLGTEGFPYSFLFVCFLICSKS